MVESVKIKIGDDLKSFPFLVSVNALSEYEKIYNRQLPDFENGHFQDIVMFFFICFREGKRRMKKLEGEEIDLPFSNLIDLVDFLDEDSPDYKPNLMDDIMSCFEDQIKKKVERMKQKKAKTFKKVLSIYNDDILSI